MEPTRKPDEIGHSLWLDHHPRPVGQRNASTLHSGAVDYRAIFLPGKTFMSILACGATEARGSVLARRCAEQEASCKGSKRPRLLRSSTWFLDKYQGHPESKRDGSAECLLRSVFQIVCHEFLVHRLAPSIHASSPHSVALMQLHFTRCDQLVTGLAPVKVRPDRAH